MHAVVLATSTESAASLHRQAFDLSEAYEGLHVQVGGGREQGAGSSPLSPLSPCLPSLIMPVSPPDPPCTAGAWRRPLE